MSIRFRLRTNTTKHGAPRRRGSLLLLCTAIALLAACGQAPVTPREAPPAPESLVWPKPPAPARIRFVKSVETPADWGLSGGAFQRFMDKVTGQTPFRFVRPTSVAARGTALYVADPGAQALVILDPAEGHERKITRVGQDNLVSPVAVALGPPNKLFLVDSALRKIFVIDGKGELLSTIGGEGRLARPAGVAYDAATDRLYVSDAAAHRIFVFAADGRLIESFGSNGSGPGEFNFPTHLALTRNGDLIVTDTLNYRVQILRRDGEPLASFGHVGDGSGNFASPKGVGADSDGNVYVVDALFDAVQIFGPDGTLLLGFGERGTRAGRFWLPNGLFIDAKDTIYVADSYNQRISVFERVTPVERTAMTTRSDRATFMPIRRHRGRIAAALALVAVALLATSPAARAQSDISKTVHNLTPEGPGKQKETVKTGLCVFCHTPHNGNPGRAHVEQGSSGHQLPALHEQHDARRPEAADGKLAAVPVVPRRVRRDGQPAGAAARRRAEARRADRDRRCSAPIFPTTIPISFVYDSALAAKHPGLVDPGNLPKTLPLDSTK